MTGTKKQVTYGMCLMVFLTNIAMLQNIFSEAMAYLPMLSVLIMAAVLMLTRSIRFISRSSLRFIAYVAVFLFGTMMLEILKGNYLSANLTYAISLSCVIYFIGYLSSTQLQKDDIKPVISMYVISTLIVSIIVYQRYYIGFQWGLRYSVYSYRGQLSQAIMFSFFALLTLIKFDKKILNIFKVLVLGFFTLLLLMMKCRAAIVEIVVGIIIMVFYRGTSKKIKNITLFLVIVFLIALVLSNDLRNLIIRDVIFYGRDATNLDDISSGRMTIFATFPSLWNGHEFLGIGSYYFECFPLNAVLQYGLFVGVIAIIIGAYPAIWSFAKRNIIYDSNMGAFLLMSSISSFVCGLFEAIAPVGPGIKFFVLWLIFGFVLGQQEKSFKPLEEE